MQYQDPSTLSDADLFRINCETREATKKRLMSDDPQTLLSMCEQEILFAIKRGESKVVVDYYGPVALQDHFNGKASLELKLLLTKILIENEHDIFEPHVDSGIQSVNGCWSYRITFRW